MKHSDFYQRREEIFSSLRNDWRRLSDYELCNSVRESLSFTSDDNPNLNILAQHAFDVLQDDESKLLYVYIYLSNIIEAKYTEHLTINKIKITLKNRMNEKIKKGVNLIESYCRNESDFFLGKQYFDLPQLAFEDNEIFVDCGAFDGATTKDFVEYIRRRGSEHKIYAFEPIPDQYKNTAENFQKWGIQNAVLIDKGVWNSESIFNFSYDPAAGTRAKIDDKGTISLPTIPIDKAIPENEKITYLKMDIEGAEYEALQGAEKMIRRWKPKLAISLYHKPQDILKIPILVMSFFPEYRFYIRHYSLSWMETVLYALPPKKQ